MLNLHQPELEYMRKLECFFRNDDDVLIFYDDEAQVLDIYIRNSVKAAALSQLMPTNINFGKRDIDINIVSTNGINDEPFIRELDKYCAAFSGNPAINKIILVDELHTIYIICARAIVDYRAEQEKNYHGQAHTLYENIAREIFLPKPGVFYCTEEC